MIMVIGIDIESDMTLLKTLNPTTSQQKIKERKEADVKGMDGWMNG